MSAILYARFSPRRNSDTCESCETQMELCREYCARQGWTVAGEYQDRALSGAEEDRPGLWEAVDALKKGDVLVVYRLDRLARSVYLSHLIDRGVEKRKARIVSISGEGTWTDTPEDQLIRGILRALSEYERKVIAARTKAAMLRHQRNGRRMSHQPPYGYRSEGARLVRDADEQAAIRRIRELWAEGRSLRAIAAELGRRKVKCRGESWHHQTIKRVLQRG